MGQVITVAQLKGGSGKTTLSVNLAVELVRRGVSVALLDTDPPFAQSPGTPRP